MLVSREQLLSISKAAQKLFFVFCVFMFMASPVQANRYSGLCKPNIQDCFDSDLWNAVQGSSNPTALLHISLMEMSGRAKCKVSYDSNGSQGYGPMQINDGGDHTGNGGTIKNCPGGGPSMIQLWQPVAYGSSECKNDKVTVIKTAVACADKIYVMNAKKCQSFAASLCAYNKGGGWCYDGALGTKEGCHKWYGARVDCGSSKDCSYSLDACTGLGTKDCANTQATITDVPSALSRGDTISNAASYSSEQMAAAGNDAAKLAPNCHDIGLMQGITMSMNKFQIGTMLMMDRVYNQHKMNNFAACIIKLVGYYDKIKALLSSSLGLLGAVLLALVATLLNYVCQYIVSAINALLASVCLPIPRMGFGMSLPGLPSASCDGLSLLNLMQAQGTFTTNIPYSTSGTSMSLGLDQLIETQ